MRLLQGQRVRIALSSGAEFEGAFAGANDSSCSLRMVQQKKLPGGSVANGNKREEPNMTFQRKDMSSAAAIGGNAKAQNGEDPHNPSF